MKHLLRQTSRYAQVGFACALLNNVIVIAMDRAGYHYAIAVTTAFLSVTLAGYFLHTAYTFASTLNRLALAKFASASLIGSCWSMLLMVLMCDGLKLSAAVAMPIATVVLFAWNFVTARWAILQRRDVAAD